MRALLLVAVGVFLVTGCNDGPNRQEVDNLYTSLELARARIAALETGQAPPATLWSDVQALRAEVAALTAENAALKSDMAKLAASKKVPHLVSRDTGVDYGVSIDGALAAWDERFAAVVDYALPRIVYFEGPNCTGNAYLDTGTDILGKFNRNLFSGDGRLFRPTSAVRANILGGSKLDATGECSEPGSFSGYPAAEAPFTTPKVAPSSLDIRPL